MKRILLILAAVLIAVPASAQLPPVQVYGSDTGTLRAVTVNASGQLSITCANCSGSGASAVDDAAFTVGTDSAAPAAFLFDDVAPDSVNEGDAGIGRMSANRNVYVTIRDAAGNERGLNIDANGALAVTGGGAGVQYTEGDTDASVTGSAIMFESNTGTNALSVVSASAPLPVSDAGGTLTVDGTVTVTDGAGSLNVICDSGCSGGTQFAEDLAHTTADVGSFMLGIRRDTTPTSSAATAGDYTALNLDANGRLYTNTTLYNADGSAATLAADMVEDAAETAGGSGPMVLSVRRDTLASSAGATGDNATFNTNAIGALYVQPTAGTSGGASTAKRTSAGSTEDEHEIKGSAGILYSVIVTNTNAAARYFRCADQVAASTTPGTTTPIIDLAIPGATTGAGFTIPLPPMGATFSTGLTCWFVTGAADTDVAEVAANEIKAFYTYK